MMPIRRFSEHSWFPDLFNDFFSNDRLFRASTTAPSVNIVEEEKDYKIEVAAPGMTKDDFDVHLSEDNELVVGMEKKTEKNDIPRTGNICIASFLILSSNSRSHCPRMSTRSTSRLTSMTVF